jgi:2,5-diamino-6-(ribosylamino)-4(3H)-pyrimidinone 5'-phosphate reductase
LPKRPVVILHNAVSLDGSTTGVEFDPGLFYRIAGRFRADAMLVGSATARAGITAFSGRIPDERPGDFLPPPARSGDRRPLWFIVDSRGALTGRLHVLRRSGYCRDVVAILSSKTPRSYVEYLKRREYGRIVAGRDRVNLERALRSMSRRYGVKAVQVDSGGGLASALLEQGLVDRLSLLVAPVIVGHSATHLFRDLDPGGRTIGLSLTDCRRLPGGGLHLVHSVGRRNTATAGRKP